MGILSSIVQTLVAAMLDMRHDLPFRGYIRSQCVGDEPLGRHALFLQQADLETLCGLGIAPGPNNLIENIAILINRPP